jgi:hypothetical protein
MYLYHASSLAFFVISVSAHGFVQQILLGDNLVDTWNPYKDPQKNVIKITRKFPDNGPVTDGNFTVSSECLHSFSGVVLLKMVVRRML